MPDRSCGLARVVLSVFSRWWQLESLYRANMKYRPVWEPRYLCFPKARDLARIAIAAGRAEGFLAFPTPGSCGCREPELAAAPVAVPVQVDLPEPPDEPGPEQEAS